MYVIFMKVSIDLITDLSIIGEIERVSTEHLCRNVVNMHTTFVSGICAAPSMT